MILQLYCLLHVLNNWHRVTFILYFFPLSNLERHATVPCAVLLTNNIYTVSNAALWVVVELAVGNSSISSDVGVGT